MVWRAQGYEATSRGRTDVPLSDGNGYATLITLTRLNGSRFVVNAEMIRTVEERPDTTIVLLNGETFIVTEKMDVVVAKAIEYGRMVRVFQP